MCEKIKKIIQRYIFTFLIMVMAAVLIVPKSFGLPDGLIDSIIVVLTLLGIIIEQHSKMTGDEGLKDKLDSFVSKVFTLEASAKLWFRILETVIFLAFGYLLLYVFTGLREIWSSGYLILRLAVPIGLVYVIVEYYNYKYKIKKINPYLIYYVYLLWIYIASVLNKFL